MRIPIKTVSTSDNEMCNYVAKIFDTFEHNF